MSFSRFLPGVVLGFVVTALFFSVENRTSSDSLKGAVVASSTSCDGLIGYWPMDVHGTVATDALNCDGTLDGTIYSTNASPTWSASHAPYPIQNAGSIYIGANDGIETPLSNPSIFTWSVWVRHDLTSVPPNHPFDMIFTTESATATTGLRLALSGSDGRLTLYNEEGYTNIGTNRAAIPSNTWTHIAVVRAGDNLSNGYGIYVNGVRTLTGPTNNKVYNGRLWIGSSPRGVSPTPVNTFYGNIDDARVYNRALTATEIAGLANGQGYDVSCTTTCVMPSSSSSVSSSVSSSLPPPPPSSSSSLSQPPLCCNVDTAQCQILSSSPDSGLCCNLNTLQCQ